MSTILDVGLNIRLSISSSGVRSLHRELQHWPKEGTNARAFRDVNRILPPKPHSDCVVLFGLATPKRNSGKVQTDNSNMTFRDLGGYGVVWGIYRNCYLLSSLLCKKKHLFKSLFTFFQGCCQQHI